MTTPYLTIDLDKIEHNARTIVELCSNRDIKVAGVTKCVCGHPEVAKAMVRAGVTAIGDSRLENIERLRAGGVDATLMLLRIPALSAVDQVVESVDLSLNTELPVLNALSKAAARRGRTHGVILMVDLGDLREGIWPDDLLAFVGRAIELPGIRIKGLGTNLACFSGAMPSEENMTRLVELARIIEQTFQIGLEWISGANSSGLSMVAAGSMPHGINHARIGEAILLGRETIHRDPWPDTYQDAFALHTEVLGLNTKPSTPSGKLGQNAFGGHPSFEERGDILCALLNVGREDADINGITPLDARFEIRGASSGYLVIDASGAANEVHVGDELVFSVNYGALLAAMTSEYVKKRLHGKYVGSSCCQDAPGQSSYRVIDGVG